MAAGVRDHSGRRPIRFGASVSSATDLDTLTATARRAEALGYTSIAVADHLAMPLAPLVTLQAVADATSTLRVAQTVLNQDFRHPAVLAKDLATLDVLSGGRLEVGIGAGWMRDEYDRAGIRYDSASVRMERLEEYVTVLAGLLEGGPFSFTGEHFTITDLELVPTPVQRPRPPIMIGGGGRKVLGVAGRRADIVQVIPTIPGGTVTFDPGEYAAATYARKLAWVREAAGDRFDTLELGTQLVAVAVTDRPDETLVGFVRGITGMIRRMGGGVEPFRAADLLDSPVVAMGSLSQVCDRLLETRERFGFTYFTTPVGAPAESLAAVVERPTGA